MGGMRGVGGCDWDWDGKCAGDIFVSPADVGGVRVD